MADQSTFRATRGSFDATARRNPGSLPRYEFSRSVIDDWSFDAEVLFIAQKHGLRIKEMPVHWHDESGTKVRIARDATRALLGLAKIRINGLHGKYR